MYIYITIVILLNFLNFMIFLYSYMYVLRSNKFFAYTRCETIFIVYIRLLIITIIIAPDLSFFVHRFYLAHHVILTFDIDTQSIVIITYMF